jgi:transaldolase
MRLESFREGERKMIDTEAVTDVAYELARRDFSHQFGRPEMDFREKRAWHGIRASGTRLWLDTGDIDTTATLWCSEFEALTTNNTLLNMEIQKGLYDDFIHQAAGALRNVAPDIDERQLVLETAFVLNAYHGLKLVELFDAHVSVELHTDLGEDVERSVACGRRYFDICPERFYVKVPLTTAGLLAARRLRQLGVPVNLTLGFSARQNYLAALLAQPRFVNVFMGRLGAFIADNGLGDGRNMGEKATLATQRELRALREAGRTRSLLIGASMREVTQVAALAGLDVYTMPPKVALEYESDPAEHVTAQIENDPPIKLGTGATSVDSIGAVLWEVPETFKESVAELLGQDLDALRPEDVQTHFARTGWGNLFPRWSEQDIQTVATDGKIPVFQTWRERLVRGDIGLDALMNLSAFHGFAADQKVLDDRVRSLI